MTGAVHVCAPACLATARRILRCSICDARRRHVIELYTWYEPASRCCACASIRPGRDRLRRGQQAQRVADLRAAWCRALTWKLAMDMVMKDIEKEKS